MFRAEGDECLFHSFGPRRACWLGATEFSRSFKKSQRCRNSDILGKNLNVHNFCSLKQNKKPPVSAARAPGPFKAALVPGEGGFGVLSTAYLAVFPTSA